MPRPHCPRRVDAMPPQMYFKPRGVPMAQLEEIQLTVDELEALRLENTLIKRYKPHYNIMLKDDKQYPYIRVSWADPFPTVEFTRRMIHDGSRYFGPFSARSIRETLDVLRKIREDDRTKRVPVVIMTTSDEEDDIADGYDSGANSYLRKPVDFTEFLSSLKQLEMYWLVLNTPPPKLDAQAS